jgi:NACHT domain
MDTEYLGKTKDLLAIAKPIVEPLITVLIAPKIKNITDYLNKRGLKIKTSTEAIEESFRSYLQGAYQRFCIMNVLVFPNQQILIQQIYQPLAIASTYGYKIIRTNRFDKDHLDQLERVLISDTGGMGKSTLMKWIGASIIEQKSSIPILIELKRLSKTHKLINEICHQLGDVFGDFDKDIITRLIKQGEFVFLLDGFDEIRDEFKEHVIVDIKSFVQKSTKNSYIITSRPESSLAAFGDFQRFNISPLALEESFELIRKYDSLNVNKIGENLIKDINERLELVQEFLVNPFLVSLLYKTYMYNKDIPSRKTTFYEEVYGALYKHHDLSKDGYKRDKKSGLDIQDFRDVLSQLAFDTAKKVEIEYYEHDLVKLLNTVRQKRVGVDFKSDDFIEDIELSVPLFSREGSVLKWAHKSLQDFFAASFISASPKKEFIIKAIYQSEKSHYLNIIDFLYEMEYKIVLTTIIYDIAKAFVEFCDNTYLTISGVSFEQIRKRQELAFDISHVLAYTEDIDSDLSNAMQSKFVKYDTIQRNTNYFAYDYTQKGFENGSIHLTSSSYRHEVLSVLIKKGIPIAKPYPPSKKARMNAEKAVTSLAFDTIYVLDDKKDNPLNAPGRFDYFTDLLLNANHESYNLNILDYDNCIKIIKLAEDSKVANQEDDDLLGL